MTNFRNLSLKGVICLGVFFFFIPMVRANPIPAPVSPFRPGIMFLYMNFLFVITLLIEILVFRLFLKKNELMKHAKDFYNSIFLVNLINFPITQIIAFVIFQIPLGEFDAVNILFISILIEIFPILLECLLYLKIYQKLNIIPCFKYPVKNMKIIKSTITANLASFVFGFITYIPFFV
ncbi:MAG: hypothetical protein ACFFA7_14740 [Promethearchaeota archaeon]